MDVDKVVDKTRHAVAKGADAAENVLDDVADKAGKASRKVKAAAEDAYDEGKDVLEGALKSATQIVRTYPIASIAVVGALAYLWGKIK